MMVVATPDDVWRAALAKASPRELLMIRLAGEAGLRRGEVAKCHRDDLIEDPRGAALIVHGKGEGSVWCRSATHWPNRCATTAPAGSCSPTRQAVTSRRGGCRR